MKKIIGYVLIWQFIALLSGGVCEAIDRFELYGCDKTILGFYEGWLFITLLIPTITIILYIIVWIGEKFDLNL